MNSLEFINLYQVGSELEFEAVEPTSLTTAVNATIFQVEVLQLLGVAFDRRHQVAVVRLTAPKDAAEAPETYVAKFYDPFSDLRAETCYHHEGPTKARALRREREMRAYQALEPIQGVIVPRFYGEYKYRSIKSPSSNGDEYRVLLFEFVRRPPLSELYGEMYFTGKVLTTSQKASLKHQLVSALHRIHEFGVFHLDLVPSNVLWNETDGPMLIDFESAQGKERITPECAEELRYTDEAQMIETMLCFGIEDDRVLLPFPPGAIR